MPWNRDWSTSKKDNPDYDYLFSEEEQKKFKELDEEGK